MTIFELKLPIMSYNSILKLRDILDDTERGYKFEQTIREILPWDGKPPVSAMGDSEQFDSIFLWKNQAYIVESKAKKDRISAGSHDWEDFELKIRRRKQSTIGLFCSLFPIHKKIYDRANELVREGYLIIILEGLFWDNLTKSNLTISDVLDYMNIYGRVKLIAIPPQLSAIVRWRYNKEEIIKRVSNICLKHSSTMLRRYKMPNHDKIYITRDIERQINSYVKELKPNTLTKEKELPKQICLLRDFSGSGKTTTSIQLSLMNDVYFGIGMTANEHEIDKKCSSFFDAMGEDLGIRELININMPIVFVIDSLDEASGIVGKKNEVLSILRYIKELNKKAEEHGLLAYPILFVFTVREDYWRDWESIFEGRMRHDINKRISYFTDEEFKSASRKYMDHYGYTITNELNSEATTVLSRPINLLIFSETNQYAGHIEVNEIWECSIIYNYFERKLDNIYRRRITGYSPKAFMNLLSEIAFRIISSKITVIKENVIEEIVEDKYPAYNAFSEEIVKVLISEHILAKNIGDNSGVRFRHSRFMEFLMAHYCIYMIKRTNKVSLLNQLTEISFNSGLVHMFRIHNDMLYICSRKYPELEIRLDSYYSKNNLFMSRKISNLRHDIASNKKIESDDIALILKNVNSRKPELIIEAFFVIASKPCKQSSSDIIDIFVIAFNSKYNVSEQYKMILKLATNNLLNSEKVLECILQSNYPRNWETYLGGIIDTMKDNYSEFIDLWRQANGKRKIERLKRQSSTEDWSQVEKLLNVILSGKEYIAGDV